MRAPKEEAEVEWQDATAGIGACQQQPRVPGCTTWRPSHAGALPLTQLARVQLTCSFCSFQPKVAAGATLGTGSLKQLIAVCSMWIITHTPLQRVSSLPDSFTAANTENPAKGASEEKCSFGALIHHFKEPLRLSFDYRRN